MNEFMLVLLLVVLIVAPFWWGAMTEKLRKGGWWWGFAFGPFGYLVVLILCVNDNLELISSKMGNLGLVSSKMENLDKHICEGLNWFSDNLPVLFENNVKKDA